MRSLSYGSYFIDHHRNRTYEAGYGLEDAVGEVRLHKAELEKKDKCVRARHEGILVPSDIVLECISLSPTNQDSHRPSFSHAPLDMICLDRQVHT